MSTSFDPLASRAPLIVYLDIKSPYAFVAKDPTYALADELGIDIDWRPLTLDIGSYLGTAKLDKRGKVATSNRSASQWSGVRYAYMDARRYASAWGYGLRGTEKIWDTRLIHLAMAWVKRADPTGRGATRRFLDAVYPAFWLRELNVENQDVVIAQIERADVAAQGFVEWIHDEGGRRHDERQADIFSAGIFGVPGYIHNREYYFGREHLPRLRQLISGDDESPDVGNALPGFEQIAARGEGKHSVFLEMQKAAALGELKIIAGVNSECIQSTLALKTIAQLREKYGDRLQFTWGEVPAQRSSSEQIVAEERVAKNMTRGDRHKAFRSNYRYNDANRYLNWCSSKRIADFTLSEAAGAQLIASGVGESFGFLFVDKSGVEHPFNGRSHLSVLDWAFASG